ncbi:MAG: hypothetical protein R2708_12905 [Vicinamibacterales bacterium]
MIGRNLVVLTCLCTAAAATAGAQTLGTFSWQLQPYCNVVAVTVVQSGAVYTLDGFDDQCGALQRAPVTGLATPNPDGSIGLGLTIVTVPGGRPVHVDARIALATLGGPWIDSGGNTGTLVFGGAAAGSPRPLPSIGAAWGTAVVAPAGATSTGLVLHKDAPTASSNPAVSVAWGPPATVGTGLSGMGVFSSSRDATAIAGVSDASVGVAGLTLTGVGVGGISTDGQAVVGLSNGSGIGVYGSSTDGIGVLANSSAGTALAISGAIEVGGSRAPAFAHVTSGGNTTGHVTTIDHELTNGDPTALVLITHAIPSGSPSGLDPHVTSVAYDSLLSRWRIVHEDFAAMPLGLQFNVLVIKR